MSKKGGRGGGHLQSKKMSLQIYTSQRIFTNFRKKKRNVISKKNSPGFFLENYFSFLSSDSKKDHLDLSPLSGPDCYWCPCPGKSIIIISDANLITFVTFSSLLSSYIYSSIMITYPLSTMFHLFHHHHHKSDNHHVHCQCGHQHTP